MRLNQLLIAALIGIVAIGGTASADTRAERIENVIRTQTALAQKLAEVRVLMGLHDSANRIAVAQGRMSASQAEADLRDYAQKIYRTDYGASEISEKRAQLESAARSYLDAIAQAAATSTQWPNNGKASDWQPQVQTTLDSVRRQLGGWLQDGLDPTPLLERAARAAGWTQGQVGAASPFAGHDANVLGAFPTPASREIMTSALGPSTPTAYTPPSTPSARPIPGEMGARPIPGEMGGARPIPGEMGGGRPIPGEMGGGRPIPGEMGGSAHTTPSAPGLGSSTTPPAPPLGSWHSDSHVTVTFSENDVRTLFSAADAAEMQEIGLELNMDHPGMELTSFDLDRADPMACLQECQDYGGCQYFTFIRPGVRGPRAWCSLKSGVPPPQASNCCVSGRP